MTATYVLPNGLPEVRGGELDLDGYGGAFVVAPEFALTAPEDKPYAVYYDVLRDKIDAARRELDQSPDTFRGIIDGAEFILPIPVDGHPIELTQVFSGELDIFALVRFQRKQMPTLGNAELFGRTDGVTYFNHHRFLRSKDGAQEITGWPQPLDSQLKKVVSAVMARAFGPHKVAEVAA